MPALESTQLRGLPAESYVILIAVGGILFPPAVILDLAGAAGVVGVVGALAGAVGVVVGPVDVATLTVSTPLGRKPLTESINALLVP